MHSQIMRKYYSFTSDERKSAIHHIITFFAEERDEEIGIIAGEQILDFFLETLAPTIHNHAINDAKNWIKNKLIHLDVDSEELKK